MTVEDDNTRAVREAREGVRSLEFFVAAMGAQLHDMHDRLARVEVVTGGGAASEALSRIESDRDDARQQADASRATISRLEEQISVLRADLQRAQISFADHHAARQEIARLRAEVQAQTRDEVDAPAPAGKKRWALGT